MKIDVSVWKERMNNLLERRKQAVPSAPKPYNIIGDYKRHLSKVQVGRSVLDVGCGGMAIKGMLDEDVHYIGIDAFPVSDEVIEMKIEDCTQGIKVDTVIAFAVLDGVQDLDKALDNMKNMCMKNVLILTGIDIEPDKFHTFKITEEFLNSRMSDMTVGYKEYFNKNVLLIEYRK